MNTFYNAASLKERRRELRKNQTGTEGNLWFHLRNRRMKNEKFYRQYSVGLYILDFYCPSKRLGIEIDGSQYYDMEYKMYDKERTEYLTENNIRLLRFTNLEILNNLDTVCERIFNYLENV